MTCVYWGYGWLTAQIVTNLAISLPLSNTKQEMLLDYNFMEPENQRLEMYGLQCQRGNQRVETMGITALQASATFLGSQS